MITLMKEAGFCDGVRYAVECTENLLDNILAGQQVFIYGNLVNNTYVMKNFFDKNFGYIDPKNIDSINAIPEGAIVAIRTHGISHDIEKKLAAKNIVIKDYTCGKVKKVHKIVEVKSSEGFKIFIVGKKNHPEVIGIKGRCSSFAHVAVKETDLNGVDLSGKICVVAQTTCDVETWENISSFILSKNPDAEIYNTLCSVIGDREIAAKKLAASSDVMLVIGDSESSNSIRLYNQCRSMNKNTFSVTSLFKLFSKPEKAPFTNSLSELEKDCDIAKILQCASSIGLTASASTPDNVSYAIRDYLLFKGFIKNAKKEIEDSTREYFESYRFRAADNSFVQSSLTSLYEQNEGGKRIRGAMIKLGEKIASHGNSENYLPIAVGYELFQTAVLIHDDIIDKSDKRRNKITIHVDSAKNIKSITDISDRSAEHFGISRALCVADYGFSISYQFFAKCKVDSVVLTKVYDFYSKIFATTCEGEIMDSILPFEKISILNNYEEYKRIVTQIYELKTAWYTLAGPIMLGAICGGASDDLLELLEKITIPLGIAFQIKDDLLGIYSSEEVLGKSILSDIREGKQTLMFGFAYKNANEQQRVLFNRHYGKENADENDLEIIRKLFEETGAKKYAEDEIQRLSDYGRGFVISDLIDEEYQSILNGLINYQIGRNF